MKININNNLRNKKAIILSTICIIIKNYITIRNGNSNRKRRFIQTFHMNEINKYNQI